LNESSGPGWLLLTVMPRLPTSLDKALASAASVELSL